jgi:hypothetical protein
MTGGDHGSGRTVIAIFAIAVTNPRSICRTMAVMASAALALLLSLPPDVLAAPPTDATSNRAARNQAARAIPWQSLSAVHRRDVQNVVQNASIYRRLPTRVIDCDPELFTFLLRHPDVVVDVWQLMGISRVALERTSADAFRGTDGAGTTGQVRYVAAEWGADARNLAVVFADGAYEGNPFPVPLRAQSVLVLRSVARRDAVGRHQVSVRIDSFVHLDQVGVELVAKTVQPWISRIADQNFVETVDFISTFSRTAEQNPQGMERLAGRLRNVDEPTRRELVRLCYRTSERYAQRERATWTDPLVLANRVGLPVGGAP